MTIEQLQSICQSEENSAELPMLNQRLNVLHETGTILLKVCLYFLFCFVIELKIRKGI